jgi:hypothetical protein
MTIANTWAVQQMDAYPEYNGETDVVFTVHWTLNGTDGTRTAGVYGAVRLTLEEGATFTPYADLTEAQVIGWVQAALGEEQVTSYEATVAQQIADQINPPVVTPQLPWIEGATI